MIVYFSKKHKARPGGTLLPHVTKSLCRPLCDSADTADSAAARAQMVFSSVADGATFELIQNADDVRVRL